MSWYLRQAEDGKAEVAYFLGLQYERGIRRGGAEQAYRWFEEAARRGHPQAAFRIAADLWPGAGDATPEDAARARELFAVASGGGLAQAAYNLAVMAERGAGGEVDLEIAEAAYRKAARGGIAPAFLRLAAVAQASGTAEDADILAWLMLGAANGDITAAEFLNQASSQTDAATLEKARLKATAW
ncbi:MAG: hypothetical protein NXI16_09890 [Alphaproteobacteria bacterium]|nr:hypothetical protein [Alphaproteobacteria bacterium]